MELKRYSWSSGSRAMTSPPRVPEPADRPLLDLPHPIPGQTQTRTHLAQRQRALAPQAEPQGHHLPLALVERRQASHQASTLVVGLERRARRAVTVGELV